jgi:Family of unknown function (DUF5715)
MLTTNIIRSTAVACVAALTFLVCGVTVQAAAGVVLEGNGTVLHPHVQPRVHRRVMVLHSAALPYHGRIHTVGHHAQLHPMLHAAVRPMPGKKLALRMPASHPVYAHPKAIAPGSEFKGAPIAAISPVLSAVELEALRTRVIALLYTPLLGSHDSLVRQNQRAEQDGLMRIEDDSDIQRQVTAKQLVALPADSGLRVDERLPVNRRYTRPWTARFLLDLARAHFERFGTALQINSAVRTVEFQKRLLRTNGNAAPAAGDDSSSHLMGGTVDIAKKPMTSTEMAWMRGFLAPLQVAGLIDVEEEFQQACFHIAVYKAYSPHPTAPAAKPAPAQLQARVAAQKMKPAAPAHATTEPGAVTERDIDDSGINASANSDAPRDSATR